MMMSENFYRKVKVVFLRSANEVEITLGASIVEAAISAGLCIQGDCGGKGLCGKYRVKVHWNVG